MRAFLVDDEPLALKRLSRLLAATGRVEMAGQSSDPEQAIPAIRAAKPDVSVPRHRDAGHDRL